MKPGWVRVSLPWYASPEDVEFTLRAVEFVAAHGEAFVPLYRLDWRDGVWRHVEGEVSEPLSLRLDAAAILGGTPQEPPAPSPAEREAEREAYFAEATRIADALAERWRREPRTWNRPTGNAEIDALVWFRYVETEGCRADRRRGYALSCSLRSTTMGRSPFVITSSLITTSLMPAARARRT